MTTAFASASSPAIGIIGTAPHSGCPSCGARRPRRSTTRACGAGRATILGRIGMPMARLQIGGQRVGGVDDDLSCHRAKGRHGRGNRIAAAPGRSPRPPRRRRRQALPRSRFLGRWISSWMRSANDTPCRRLAAPAVARRDIARTDHHDVHCTRSPTPPPYLGAWAGDGEVSRHRAPRFVLC